jgi:hypothetical protein
VISQRKRGSLPVTWLKLAYSLLKIRISLRASGCFGLRIP